MTEAASGTSAHSPSDGEAHVGFLDGLRGIAILLVVAYHAWTISWLPQGPFEFITVTGYYGVPMFFFISGFCLFYPYAGGCEPPLGGYVVKRLAKIVPSYYLALLTLWWLAPTGVADLVRHLLFAHNLDQRSMFTISSVFWTLGVEVQFYVIFPALAWALVRWPWAVATLALVGSVAYRMWARRPDRFYMDQLPGFLDCFVLGALASLLLVKWPLRNRALATVVAMIGTGLVLGYLALLYRVRYEPLGPGNYHVWGRLLFSYGLLLVTLGAGSAFVFNRVLNWRGLTFLSLISYNLYLWHLAIMDWFWRRHWPTGTADGHADLRYQVAFNVTAIAAAVLWTWLLTRCYERPILRHFAAKLRRPQGYVSPNP